MMHRARQAALPPIMMLASTLAHAAGEAPPAVPAALEVPAGEVLVLQMHATGAQIYLCTPGSDGKPQWTLKAPDAVLRDTKGKVIGHHAAGPSWRHEDGSAVTGKAAARVDAPDASSIPWLLLTVVDHMGSGVLSTVTHVQRLHTSGGQPPPASTCDAAKQGTEERVPYSADYLFYAPPAR
jgi:hypothetical protein